MKVEEYEKKVIGLLCADVIPNSTLHIALNNPDKIECKFTGAGYYLDVYHNELPTDRIVCDKPIVNGYFQETEVSFIVFIESGILCLECYNYGHQGVSPTIRNGLVEIFLP